MMANEIVDDVARMRGSAVPVSKGSVESIKKLADRLKFMREKLTSQMFPFLLFDRVYARASVPFLRVDAKNRRGILN